MGAIPLTPQLPQYKDQLSMLFANLANPNATTAPAPGATTPTSPARTPQPIAAPPVARPPVSTPAAAPSAPAPPLPAPITNGAPPAPASDDPSISPLPKPPDLSQSPVASLLKQYNDTQSKIAAVPPVDYNAKKPSPWSRLLGGIVGTAAGYGGGPQVAQQVARGVTYRTLNQADIERQRQLDPLFQQLQTEREGIPLAQAASQVPQQDFENNMSVAKESRERAAEKSASQYKSDIADIRQQVATNNNANAKSKLEELATKLQNDATFREGLLSNKSDALALRSQMADMANQLRQKQLDQEKEKYQSGNSVKALEDERKNRTTAIENEWKTSFTKIKGLFGVEDKQKELKDVNDDINTRLRLIPAEGSPGVPPGRPAPNAGLGAHPAPPPGAHSEVYAPDGKTLTGHIVGNKYVPIGR